MTDDQERPEPDQPEPRRRVIDDPVALERGARIFRRALARANAQDLANESEGEVRKHDR